MNKTTADIIKNSLSATLGLIIFGFGIYLSVQANIGVSPWDVFCIGLSKKLGVIYGTANISICVLVIVIDIALKEKIGIGTILDAIVVAKSVDFFNWLGLIKTITDIWVGIPTFVLSTFIMAFSQYFYMKAGLSCGPRDSLQIGLAKRLPKLSVGFVNIIIQVTVMTIGYFLGGPLGVGSFLASFFIGFFQNLIFKWMKFEPKKIEHQNLVESFKVIFHRWQA